MQKIFTALCISINLIAYGQNCNCDKEFAYIKNYMENNYVGFKDKVNTKTIAHYNAFAASLNTKTGTANQSQCILAISEYLDFFKDGHVYMSLNETPDSAFVNTLVRQSEQVQLTKEQLARLIQAKGLEGIYVSADSAYKIAVIKNVTKDRDYVGVIVAAKSANWKANQVKFTLKQLGNNECRYLVYNSFHTPNFDRIKIIGNSFDGWFKEGSLELKNNTINKQLNEWKKLNATTNYVAIKSFGEENTQNIDSLFKVHKSELDSTPNLIIDLRDNSGGSDFSYAPIKPYLYTNPVKNIGADVYATEGSIQGWEKLFAIPGLPEDAIAQLKEIVAQMKAHKNLLMELVPDNIDSNGTTLKFPKKIAILINRGCASATEEFILRAMQSKKVILVGENTWGILDYANVREAAFSCMPYTLEYATTRSRRIDIGQGVDNIGIAPNVRLSEKQNWINETIKLLDK